MSERREMLSDDADLMRGGRLFQTRGPATGKARSPYVDSQVRRTIKLMDDAVYDGSQYQTNVACFIVNY